MTTKEKTGMPPATDAGTTTRDSAGRRSGQKMPQPPDWTTREAEGEYHARSKSGEVMSSGMLRKFAACPAAYRETILGNVREKERTAYRFGGAAHKLILEGDKAFAASYPAGGPVNPKTGRTYGVGTKAHDEWLAENGYTREQVITEEELDSLIRMANAVRAHGMAAAYLSYGWPELVARAVLHGVACQIRMDWLTHDAAGKLAIVDLKTTDDMTWFESDAERYGYLNQFAFYRDVAEVLVHEPVDVAVIAVEKKEPWRTAVWRLPPEVLDYYTNENKAVLARYVECRLSGVWPTGYEGVREWGLPREKKGAVA